MKLGIIADIHLSQNHPERLKALKSIFNKLKEQKISHIIIAGDLFDKDKIDENLKDFNRIAEQFSDFKIYIIPGNHDASTKKNYFTDIKNLNVFSEPNIIDINNTQFFFIPYRDGNMGEVIAEFHNKLKPGKWILISHGDYTSEKDRNIGEEKDAYFPISKADINNYKPTKIFLGHIHQNKSYGNRIFYPGSIFPIAGDEFGIRKFIILDTESNDVNFVPIDTEVIYIKERLNVIPVKDIEKYLGEKIEKIKNDWKEMGVNTENVSLTIELTGYTDNKVKVTEFVNNLRSSLNLKDVKYIDKLKISEMQELKEFTEKFLNLINELKIESKTEYIPDRDEIILQGEEIIYSQEK